MAVLEEEVVRLEEKVVHFRQGLYQEAVQISSSKKNIDNLAYLCDSARTKDLKPKQPSSSLEADAVSPVPNIRKKPSLSGNCNYFGAVCLYWLNTHRFLKRQILLLQCDLDERRGKENQSGTNSSKNKQPSPNSKVQTIGTPVKRRLLDPKALQVLVSPFFFCQQIVIYLIYDINLVSFWIFQLKSHVEKGHEGSEQRNAMSRKDILCVNGTPNKISENILRCLMNICLKMSAKKSRSTAENLPSRSALNSSDIFEYTEFKDPYSIGSKFGKRDIGPYKHLFAIEATSLNPNKTTISVLVQRLK